MSHVESDTTGTELILVGDITRPSYHTNKSLYLTGGVHTRMCVSGMRVLVYMHVCV